ncbi:succinyl-diaminopimelate desuccinylase [Citricoccus sp.]|uniref:succinyl-diaminopimelate desuccinylase n=1 Tax=Citricoccus sp. TaxID=1978372 RepID=UPI002624FD03|nr:succinyl-diaminopimelate desuccinylase [Citricoccus sp.]HRO29677.1 succinyl-diaminopimelate desuccinylase [Citricoccus sp.]HRO93898.1 succinyl-diaminopimelate desuccinylase [Citricoccus sp.]
MDSSLPVTTAPVLPPLDLDVALLTAELLDIHSVSDHETLLADAVEEALRALPALSVQRIGDAVVARTEFGLDSRVVLAGHLDTVPLPTVPGARGTVPSRWEPATGVGTVAAVPADGDVLYGRGATDMKGGVAVQLALAGLLGRDAGPRPARDVTWVFYDHEEVEAARSGLGRIARQASALLEADFAVLLEPTDGVVEGGCNGTSRYLVTVPGVAAHTGRSWRGVNAIHATAPLLTVLAAYEPATVTVEGLDYREGLNAVRIHGGTAGNVVPDSCAVEVNYRFAPDKTVEQAHEHVYAVLSHAGISPEAVEVTDASPAARPGLDHPAAAAFVAAVGGVPMPKYGWTDVARFSELGVPAVNFGPGDALLAHADDEHVTAGAVRACLGALRRWLVPESDVR